MAGKMIDRPAGVGRVCRARASVRPASPRALLPLLLALTVAARGEAEQQDDRKRLQTIEGKIADVRAAISDQVEREKSELTQIEQIDHLVALLAEQIVILDREVAAQQVKVDDAERRMAALQADFDEKKTALKERLVVLYKMGELSYARLLLSVDDATNLARAYVYVSKMVESDREKVEAYQAAFAALEGERTALQGKATELTQLQQANQAKRGELDAERRRKQEAIGEIRREKWRHLQMLADLEASAQQLRKLLNELPPTVGQLSISKFKGAIKWPHAGKVSLGFGLHKHPQFNTITVQNGLDIEALFGDPVSAVFGGKVVFADWFRGYGNLVILEHGDKFFSLYAHLSRIGVALGDMVAPAQVIGFVGDSASLKGAYLYFELRHGDQPLNPVEWLERRKSAG
ncbi:MAG: peptidoglycan DD-metalloendopeptidase family protein [Acidobacteria bacterium]|nr:peptidoglycan DD-metalloendopeptidase family protein [Acidobacteriota bacterium]